MRTVHYKNSKMKFLALILFLFPFCFAGSVLGLPCNGKVVNVGETREEVAAKCGEAALKEQRTVKVEEVTEQRTSTTVTTIDEWTYYSGPEEPVQSYRFEKGKVIEIINNGYWAVQDFSVDTCRNGEALAIGDGTVETYLKCGEPISKERLANRVIESEYGMVKRRSILPVVEWTYRYGPDAPGYAVTFENGVAVKIKQVEFGK